MRKKTANWYGKYKNADCIQARVPLSSNKVASEQMLAELVRTVELGKAGLIDPFETHRKRPLREHLTDFRQHLETKGNSESYVDLTVSRVTAALTGAGFKVLGDLNADKVANWPPNQRSPSRRLHPTTRDSKRLWTVPLAPPLAPNWAQWETKSRWH